MRFPTPFALRTLTLLGVALWVNSLVGCASRKTADSFLGVITPYRTEVVQGNVVTAEQAALIRPGMTRSQVRDALGSPMLADLFHADRWDYVFTIQRQGTQPQHRHVVVLFSGDKLLRMEAPVLPVEREFVSSIDVFKPPHKPKPLALTQEQINALPRPPQPAPHTPAAKGPARSYPPLEPQG